MGRFDGLFDEVVEPDLVEKASPKDIGGRKYSSMFEPIEETASSYDSMFNPIKQKASTYDAMFNPVASPATAPEPVTDSAQPVDPEAARRQAILRKQEESVEKSKEVRLPGDLAARARTSMNSIKASTELGSAVISSMWSGDDTKVDPADKFYKTLQELDAQTRANSPGPFGGQATSDAAAFMSQQGRMLWDAKEEAAAGAAIGAVVGGIGSGGIAAVHGALAGEKLGRAAGLVKGWYLNSVGDFYSTLKSKGIDSDLAKNAAVIGAVPHAAVEFLSGWMMKVAGLGKLGLIAAKPVISASIYKYALSVAKAWGFNAAAEASEETGQSWIEDVTYNWVATFQNETRGTDLEKITMSEGWAKGVDAFAQSIIPMLIGAGVTGGPANLAGLNKSLALRRSEQQGDQASAESKPAPTTLSADSLAQLEEHETEDRKAARDVALQADMKKAQEGTFANDNAAFLSAEGVSPTLDIDTAEITEEQRQYSKVTRMIAEQIFQTPVVFLNDAAAERIPDGMYTSNAIYLKPGTGLDVMFHEQGHGIARWGMNQEAHKQTITDTIDFFKAKEEYWDTFKDAMKGRGVTLKELDEETMAMVLSEVLSNEKAITELAQSNPGLLQRLITMVKDFFESLGSVTGEVMGRAKTSFKEPDIGKGGREGITTFSDASLREVFGNDYDAMLKKLMAVSKDYAKSQQEKAEQVAFEKNEAKQSKMSEAQRKHFDEERRLFIEAATAKEKELADKKDPTDSADSAMLARNFTESVGFKAFKDALEKGGEGRDEGGFAAYSGEAFRKALEAGKIAEQKDLAAKQALMTTQKTAPKPAVNIANKTAEVRDQWKSPALARGEGGIGPLYHWTSNMDFSEFDTSPWISAGAHFGTEKHALNYARDEGALGKGTKGRTVKVSLKINNPLRLPDLGTWSARVMLAELPKHGIDVSWIKFYDAPSQEQHKQTHVAIRKAIEDAGYDGIVYKNHSESGAMGRVPSSSLTDSYIAFHPEQIFQTPVSRADDDDREFTTQKDTTTPLTDLAKKTAAINAQWKTAPMRAMAGEGAETANIGNVSKAKRMLSEGVSMNRIRRETGWEKAVKTEKWMFEIDPSKMKPVFAPGEGPGTIDDYGTLGELIRYPELFAAYPALRSVTMSYAAGPDGKAGAHFDERNNEIFLGWNSISNRRDMSFSLMHEIQHAIQVKEGFEKGSSVESASALAEKIAVVEISKKWLADPVVNKWLPDDFEQLLKNIIHDDFGYFKHINEVIDAASSGGAPSAVYGRLAELRDSESDKLYNVKRHGLTPIGYYRITGEALARTAAYRLRLTDSERKNTSIRDSLINLLKAEGIMQEGQEPEDVLINKNLDKEYASLARSEDPPTHFRRDLKAYFLDYYKPRTPKGREDLVESRATSSLNLILELGVPQIAAVRKKFGKTAGDLAQEFYDDYTGKNPTQKDTPTPLTDLAKKTAAINAQWKTAPMRAMAGPWAKTAPVGQADRARVLAKQGQSAVSIWRLTGWFRGYDDMWRFEIDDEDVVVKPEYIKALRAGSMSKSAQLSNVLKAGSKVLQAYPELADIKLTVGIDSGARIVYGEGNVPTIIVLPAWLPFGNRLAPSVSDYRRVIMHEVQHAIQDMEGFAAGGDLETGREYATATRLNKNDAVKTREQYTALLNEVLDDYPTLSEQWDEDKIRAEMRRRDPELVAKAESKEVRDEASSEYGKKAIVDDLLAHNHYMRLAGEAEARLVERRLNMTPEQRYAEPPWETMEKMLKDKGLLEEGQKPEDVLIVRPSVDSPALARVNNEPPPPARRELRGVLTDYFKPRTPKHMERLVDSRADNVLDLILRDGKSAIDRVRSKFGAEAGRYAQEFYNDYTGKNLKPEQQEFALLARSDEDDVKPPKGFNATLKPKVRDDMIKAIQKRLRALGMVNGKFIAYTRSPIAKDRVIRSLYEVIAKGNIKLIQDEPYVQRVIDGSIQDGIIPKVFKKDIRGIQRAEEAKEQRKEQREAAKEERQRLAGMQQYEKGQQLTLTAKKGMTKRSRTIVYQREDDENWYGLGSVKYPKTEYGIAEEGQDEYFIARSLGGTNKNEYEQIPLKDVQQSPDGLSIIGTVTRDVKNRALGRRELLSPAQQKKTGKKYKSLPGYKEGERPAFKFEDGWFVTDEEATFEDVSAKDKEWIYGRVFNRNVNEFYLRRHAAGRTLDVSIEELGERLQKAVDKFSHDIALAKFPVESAHLQSLRLDGLVKEAQKVASGLRPLLFLKGETQENIGETSLRYRLAASTQLDSLRQGIIKEMVREAGMGTVSLNDPGTGRSLMDRLSTEDIDLDMAEQDPESEDWVPMADGETLARTREELGEKPVSTAPPVVKIEPTVTRTTPAKPSYSMSERQAGMLSFLEAKSLVTKTGNTWKLSATMEEATGQIEDSFGIEGEQSEMAKALFISTLESVGIIDKASLARSAEPISMKKANEQAINHGWTGWEQVSKLGARRLIEEAKKLLATGLNVDSHLYADLVLNAMLDKFTDKGWKAPVKDTRRGVALMSELGAMYVAYKSGSAFVTRTPKVDQSIGDLVWFERWRDPIGMGDGALNATTIQDVWSGMVGLAREELTEGQKAMARVKALQVTKRLKRALEERYMEKFGQTQRGRQAAEDAWASIVSELGAPIDNSEKLADPSDNYTMELAKLMEFHMASKSDKALEYWKSAGLLSGIATIIQNPISNAVRQAYEYGPKKLVVDTLRGKNPVSTIHEMMSTAMLHGQFARRAWAVAKESFNKEYPLIRWGAYGSKLDPGTVRHAIKGEKGKIIRLPYRFLTGGDEYFKALDMQTSIANYYFQQTTRGIDALSGDSITARTPTLSEIQKFVDDVIAKGQGSTSGLYNKALFASMENTWQNENRFAKPFATARSALPGHVGEYVMPFINTPMNIFTQGLRMSPLGIVNLGRQAIKNSMQRSANKEVAKYVSLDNEMFTRDLGEQIIAWGALMALMPLVKDDDDEDADTMPHMTGSNPAYKMEPGKGGFMRQETMPPLHVRIGDKMFDYSRIEPMATVLPIIIDNINAYNKVKQGEKAGKAIATAYAALGVAATDKTFLGSLHDLVMAQQNPEELGRFASNFAASWIPNIVRQTMRLTDPYARDLMPKGERFSKEWAVSFSKNTGYAMVPAPALSKGLGLLPPPRYDYWGKPVSKTNVSASASDFLYRLASLSGVKVKLDKDQELNMMLHNWNQRERFVTDPNTARLNNPRIYGAKFFERPGRSIQIGTARDGTAVNYNLNNEEYEEYIKLSGTIALEQAQKTAFDYTHPTIRDITRLSQIVETARRIARNRIKKKIRRKQ